MAETPQPKPDTIVTQGPGGKTIVSDKVPPKDREYIAAGPTSKPATPDQHSDLTKDRSPLAIFGITPSVSAALQALPSGDINGAKEILEKAHISPQVSRVLIFTELKRTDLLPK